MFLLLILLLACLQRLLLQVGIGNDNRVIPVLLIFDDSTLHLVRSMLRERYQRLLFR